MLNLLKFKIYNNIKKKYKINKDYKNINFLVNTLNFQRKVLKLNNINWINLFFYFKYNFKYYYCFKYNNYQTYSFSYNHKINFLKKYKLITGDTIKLKFIISLKHLLYLSDFFNKENTEIILNFNKLNFLFFNYSMLFIKFFNFFFYNGRLKINYDRNNNVYYFKKKRAIKKNRLKKIKIYIRMTKLKYNEYVKNL